MKADFNSKSKQGEVPSYFRHTQFIRETVEKYDVAIPNLEEVCPGAKAELTERLSPEQWALAHDGNLSWGKLTTNSFESVNSLSKRARSLPVQALASAIFYRMNAWFVNR
ncbi:hypothetical protein H6P81_016239 [Aristolochia fimbriata]|uniref:Uncharacterized protein n=1 Tax=Aristolochia fimbriata TaxID=158543 RepID=A0AAV7E8E5_ARIFI|nr:hypothetical protein H6P81_016239 [Aristolochia fimbriata]